MIHRLQKKLGKNKKLLETLYCFAILTVFCWVMALLFQSQPVEGEALQSPVVQPIVKKPQYTVQEVKAPVIAKSDVWRPTGKEVEARIRAIAVEIGLKDIERALAIGRCESGLNAAAIGDHGLSHGIWQIHLPSHPDITKQQAHDVDWSTRWALNRMKQGSWSLWTCNRLIN